MAETRAGQPGLAVAVQQAVAELDELVDVVTGMLKLFCGEAPADAAAKTQLQEFGQQYQTRSAQLRLLIRQVAQAAAARQPPQPAGVQPACKPEGDTPAELSADLERLRQAATDKNAVLFKLITQLRDMLDNIVMWETFNKSLANDPGKKQDRK